MPTPANPHAYPYGPAAPVLNGNVWTVDRFLKNPTVIQKTLENMNSQQFVAELIFRQSNADAGVVIYDEAASQDLYVNVDPNLQPRPVEPGSEFPNVGFVETAHMTVVVTEYGGKFFVSYTQQRRDQRDVITRNLFRLSNTLRQQSNNRAIAVLNNHPRVVKVAAAATWDGVSPKIVSDVQAGISAINNTDLGYNCDTAIINPNTASLVMNQESIWSRLPREDTARNPLLNPQLNGLLSLNWIESRLQPVGQVTLLQRGMVGAIGEEIPQYTQTIDDPERRRWIVQSGRIDVPFITDPLAAYVITGVHS